MKLLIAILALASLAPGQTTVGSQVAAPSSTKDNSGAAHTLPAIVVGSVGALPATGCKAGELAMVTAATLGQQIYENSGTGSCVWTQQLNSGGGGPNLLTLSISGGNLSIGNCSSGTPCLINPGTNTIGSFVSNGTAAPASGSDTWYVYVTTGGTLTVGYSSVAPTCTNCTAQTGISAFPFGYVVGKATVTSGAVTAVQNLNAVQSGIQGVNCGTGLIASGYGCALDTSVALTYSGAFTVGHCPQVASTSPVVLDDSGGPCGGGTSPTTPTIYGAVNSTTSGSNQVLYSATITAGAWGSSGKLARLVVPFGLGASGGGSVIDVILATSPTATTGTSIGWSTHPIGPSSGVFELTCDAWSTGANAQYIGCIINTDDFNLTGTNTLRAGSVAGTLTSSAAMYINVIFLGNGHSGDFTSNGAFFQPVNW